MTVDPPPAEVLDFCMPLGGRLQRIPPKEEDAIVTDILYGKNHSRRNGRCFVFIIEDKTIDTSGNEDNESGIGSTKRYGICLIHDRLLSTVQDPGNGTDEKITYSFMSPICYAFITRFPLFDFFFQVLFDMITAERLERMELIAKQDGEFTDEMALGCNSYKYLPQNLIGNILERLTMVSPPKYKEALNFMSGPSINPIEMMRLSPKGDHSEHGIATGDWALPALLSWMPVETLIWALSLLLCESKIIIIGAEPGMVSCGVMGLLALIYPLTWTNPLIPVLPMKLLDFVESPVPIIAGLVVDGCTPRARPEQLLKLCNDLDNGTVSAVFDVSARELYVSGLHHENLENMIMPEAELLAENLQEHLHSSAERSSSLSQRNHQRRWPAYVFTRHHHAEAKNAQGVIEEHIRAVVNQACDVHSGAKNSARHGSSVDSFIQSNGSLNGSATGSADEGAENVSEDIVQSVDLTGQQVHQPVGQRSAWSLDSMDADGLGVGVAEGQETVLAKDADDVVGDRRSSRGSISSAMNWIKHGVQRLATPEPLDEASHGPVEYERSVSQEDEDYPQHQSSAEHVASASGSSRTSVDSDSQSLQRGRNLSGMASRNSMFSAESDDNISSGTRRGSECSSASGTTRESIGSKSNRFLGGLVNPRSSSKDTATAAGDSHSQKMHNGMHNGSGKSMTPPRVDVPITPTYGVNDVIPLSRVPFRGNADKFIRNFVKTQIFAEHIDVDENEGNPWNMFEYDKLEKTDECNSSNAITTAHQHLDSVHEDAKEDPSLSMSPVDMMMEETAKQALERRHRIDLTPEEIEDQLQEVLRSTDETRCTPICEDASTCCLDMCKTYPSVASQSAASVLSPSKGKSLVMKSGKLGFATESRRPRTGSWGSRNNTSPSVRSTRLLKTHAGVTRSHVSREHDDSTRYADSPSRCGENGSIGRRSPLRNKMESPEEDM
jgi:hypothetical protein